MIKKHIAPITVISAVIMVLGYMLLTNWSTIYDFVFQTGKQYDKRIAIVTIDMDSIDDINQGQHREHLAELIDKISSGKPSAIGVDYVLDNQSDDQKADMKLAESITKAGNVVLGCNAVFSGVTVEESSENGELVALDVNMPLKSLMENAKVGIINKCVNKNDLYSTIIYRCKYENEFIYDFSSNLFDVYMTNKGEKTEFLLKVLRANLLDIQFINRHEVFERINSKDLLSNKVDPRYLKDKIVLVGINPQNQNMKVRVSLKERSPMDITELDANLLQYYTYLYYKDYARRIIYLPILITLLISTITLANRRNMRSIILAALSIAGVYAFFFRNAVYSILGKVIMEVQPVLTRLHF